MLRKAAHFGCDAGNDLSPADPVDCPSSWVNVFRKEVESSLEAELLSPVCTQAE